MHHSWCYGHHYTTEIVLRLCANWFAFLLFGTPEIPQLCKEKFNLVGFLLQYICDPQTDEIPVGFDLINHPSQGHTDAPDDPDGPEGGLVPEDSSDQDPSGTISLPSQSGLTAFKTSGLSPFIRSIVSSRASSGATTGSFVDIFSDLIMASVPIPAYAAGIPVLGMGSSIAIANGSLRGPFATLVMKLTSWLAAYSALSIANANGIASGKSTVNSNCVMTT